MKKNFVFFDKKIISRFLVVFAVCAFCILPAASQSSQNRNFPNGSIQGTTQMNQNIRNLNIPNVNISVTQPQTGRQMAFSIQLLLMLTVLSLAPSILIVTTCFLRFSIVLDFIKRALSLQQVPPTSVLNGMALFMTLFVMWPVFNQVYSTALKLLSDGNMSLEQAYDQAALLEKETGDVEYAIAVDCIREEQAVLSKSLQKQGQNLWITGGYEPGL